MQASAFLSSPAWDRRDRASFPGEGRRRRARARGPPQTRPRRPRRGRRPRRLSCAPEKRRAAVSLLDLTSSANRTGGGSPTRSREAGANEARHPCIRRPLAADEVASALARPGLTGDAAWLSHAPEHAGEGHRSTVSRVPQPSECGTACGSAEVLRLVRAFRELGIAARAAPEIPALYVAGKRPGDQAFGDAASCQEADASIKSRPRASFENLASPKPWSRIGPRSAAQ